MKLTAPQLNYLRQIAATGKCGGTGTSKPRRFLAANGYLMNVPREGTTYLDEVLTQQGVDALDVAGWQ